MGFAKAAHKLAELKYSPLNVEESGWAKDFGEYSAALGVLEQKFAATASTAIDRAGCLQARMELIMVRHNRLWYLRIKVGASRVTDRPLYHKNAVFLR